MAPLLPPLTIDPSSDDFDIEDGDVQEAILMRVPDAVFRAMMANEPAGQTGDPWLDDYIAELEANP